MISLLWTLLCIHFLIFLAWLSFKLFEKFSNLEFQSNFSGVILKWNYLLLILCLVIPMTAPIFEGDSLFRPVAHIWSPVAGEKLGQATAIEDKFSFGIQQDGIIANHSWSLEGGWVNGVVIFLLGLSGLGFLRFLWEVLRAFHFIGGLQLRSFKYKGLKNLEILFSEEVASPFSISINGRKIFLPSRMIGNVEWMKSSMAHEIQHLRNKDTLTIYFLELFRGLFFYNPVVHKWLDEIFFLQELNCDSKVLKKKVTNKNEYGLCLLEFAERQSEIQDKNFASFGPCFGRLGMASDATHLKRRISMILSTKNSVKSKWVKGLSLTMGIVLTIAVATTAWAFSRGIEDRRISLEQAQEYARSLSEGTDFEIAIDERVLYWLNQFVGNPKRRAHFKIGLDRMQKYEQMISGKLRRADLPLEFLVVPLVESGYKNTAMSSGGAAGLWQFIPGTARRYGLTVNSEVDERLNPVKATDAAIEYLEDLNQAFSNWHYALTSYNCGEGKTLSELIRSRKGATSLEVLKEGSFKNETKNYLPKIIAAAIIFKNRQMID